jgi:hypothetical protein
MEYAAIGQPISAAAAILRQVEGTGVWISERTLGELPRARYKVQDAPPIAEPKLKVFRLQR